jgi:alkanesulfonate monooxygenase SsuD/methylene tetrahydromethanopterin reductase-like flavin-dependent oxidoreductase (luciferase family)
VKLSALDIGPVDWTFRLAAQLEAAGFHRLWVGEHQPQPQPQLVVALLAGMTETIRVGTAGVLLHYIAPSRAAFDFQFLATCFPDRIDAGICAGLVGDLELERDQLDGRDRTVHLARYDERVAAFLASMGDRSESLEIWSHGSGPRSARRAARHGLRFGYSLFHGISVDDPRAMETYRAEFAPARAGDEPYAALAVAGVCAATGDEARRIAAGHQNPFFALRVVGSPEECRRQLDDLIERYRPDEIVFSTLGGDYNQRVASYRLLAGVMA